MKTFRMQRRYVAKYCENFSVVLDEEYLNHSWQFLLGDSSAGFYRGD
jgi:hypothetical protein